MTGKARVMFVDDETRVLDGLRRSFRRYESRWEMAFFSSPLEALKAFRIQPPDVVVTDMKMPDLTGIQLVAAMRQAAGGVTHYIILTGTADLRTAIDAINQVDIFRFFTKPCPSFLLAEGIDAALAAQIATAASTTAPGLGETALDRLAVAVLVVDAEARLLFMNRRGGEFCAAGTGIILGSRKICRAATPAATQTLHGLIASAITGGEGGVMALEREEGTPLSVAVTALDGADGGGKAALYISDPDDHPIPAPEQLARLLGLTLAEARLTHALAAGFSLDDAAADAEITISTARGYLKQIFTKTGKSRQADLVRLVLTLPALAP